MLSLQTLDMLLAIGENELIDELLISLLATSQIALLLNKFPRIKQALLKDLPAWKNRLRQELQHAQVPPALAQEFYHYQHCQGESSTVFITHLPQTVATLHQWSSPFSTQASALLNTMDPTLADESFKALFLQRWHLSLTLQTIELHSQFLEQEREQLLAELEKRLVLSSELEPLLVENDNSAGRLWDMSRGALQHGDFRPLLDYGAFLQQQPELQKLAQQLGRSHEAKAIPQQEAEYESYRVLIRYPATIPEQICGIHQSDDILRLLPSELATLGIDDLEYEFYRRLLERQLLTYRLQGDAWREKIIQRPVVHQQQDQQPRGPFIVCVDTSGSMGGFNERCAKAFCLALLRIALADNRRCHIMLFASDIVHYELTCADGIEQVLRFLGQQFRGGTDLAACLRSTLDKMNQPQWYDADSVIISDFIAQRLPDDVVKSVKSQQQHQQQRFHAVAMSTYGKPGIMRIFDQIWRFDTGLKSRLLRRWQR